MGEDEERVCGEDMERVCGEEARRGCVGSVKKRGFFGGGEGVWGGWREGDLGRVNLREGDLGRVEKRIWGGLKGGDLGRLERRGFGEGVREIWIGVGYSYLTRGTFSQRLL